MIEPEKIIKSNRKTLCLKISQDGKLIVRAPKRMGLETIFNFIKEKENWIAKKQQLAKNIMKSNYDIFNYNRILFLGKSYDVVEVNGRGMIHLSANYLEIPNKFFHEKEHYIKQWYLSFVEEILFNRIDYIGKIMNLQAKEISIINSKTKWGMCNQNGVLYFNWRLLMLEPGLLDYVIIHEFAHLRMLNHSKAFWEIVESVLPNYKELQHKLNNVGFLLKLL